MKNILVTGGFGFIGFNFINYVLKKYPKYNVVCLDAMTYAAEPFLQEKIQVLDKKKVPVYKYNIIDPQVAYVLKIEKIDTVVNFAAETHVDNSIKDAAPFITSNIVGVFNLLEACKEHGIRFHQIGTDEVYGSTTPEQNVDEAFTLIPSSPYSASKASADMLALSYFRTFGLPVTVSRCTNNFGPYQHVEKLLPKVICNALLRGKIPMYGDGKQRRFWIHVDDHSEAIMKILENGKLGETYNIAPPDGNLIMNKDLIKMVLDYLGKDFAAYVKRVKDRPGHDSCYYINGEKIKRECGYDNEKRDFTQDLHSTIDWYKERFELP